MIPPLPDAPPRTAMPGDLLVNRLRPDLLRLARQLTRAEDNAQDLVQETLLRVWHREQTHPIDDPCAYARTALRNLFYQSLRRAPFLELDDSMDDGAAPQADAVLALGDLTRAVARLPPDQAQLIRLVAAGETSPQVLARRLDCPVGTVMSRLARARARLRDDMGLAPDAPVRSLY